MKFIIGTIWLLSIAFCAWIFTDYGIVEGQRMEKAVKNTKLAQCNRIIAKGVFQ